MKPNSVQTSIDIPRDLHRKLRERLRRGAVRLVRLSWQQLSKPWLLLRRSGKVVLKLDRPVVASPRKPFSLTNEEIYELGLP